jgi:hypothetical protein
MNSANPVSPTRIVHDDEAQRRSYTELGLRIRDEGPYGDGLLQMDKLVESAWLKEHDIDNPKVVKPKDMKTSEHEQCYHWFVDGQERRITKVARLPYTYQRPTQDEQGKQVFETVTTFLVIGWEGPGH